MIPVTFEFAANHFMYTAYMRRYFRAFRYIRKANCISIVSDCFSSHSKHFFRNFQTITKYFVLKHEELLLHNKTEEAKTLKITYAS